MRTKPSAATQAVFFRLNDGLFAALLLAATTLAYHGAWHAGFVWDDDGHVTRPEMRSLHGLWRTWFEPGATQQYYPILHSAFWMEHRLWGDAAAGYHLANILLHVAAAFLLYRVLRALQVPGAPLAAAAFALHPVSVESVAWISEQKNTLSAVFYLASALAYLQFDRDRRRGGYALALVLFVAALLTKSVTATLPAALLVVFWWKRGRLSWRGDIAPLLPWFVLGGASGIMTSWMERTFIGARGGAYAMSVADRFLVAGRASWFYLGKLAWPSDLMFVYPRWSVDDRAAWQYLYPAAAVAVLAALYAFRKDSRGPLAAALLFVGTLFPALGFISVYPFVYSYVADHFQYLASMAAISAACAGLTLAVVRLNGTLRGASAAAAFAVLAALAWLTSRQCAMYADAETLWLATIERNPQCWVALGGLGDLCLKEGRVPEAVSYYERAIAIDASNVGSHNDLGIALLSEGKVDEAVAQFQATLGIDRDNAEAHNSLGNILAVQRRYDEAVVHYTRALEIAPQDSRAHYNLGSAFLRLGRAKDAAAEFRRAVDIVPDDAGAHYSLGDALMQMGQDAGAIAEYRLALNFDARNPGPHMNMGAIYLKEGKTQDAIAEFQDALGIDSRDSDARYNLGNALLQAGRLDEAVAQFQKVLEDHPDDLQAHQGLGTALFKKGRIDEADAQFQLARRPR
jgi:tetratricopeptide (TPR) repeat protein